MRWSSSLVCGLAVMAGAAACSHGVSSSAPPTTATSASTSTTTATAAAAAPSVSTTAPPCATDRGRLTTESITATVRAAVYLPPCAAESGRRYPTVYLLHGGGADQTQWPAIGLATEADKLRLPLIVVMPNWLAAGESSVVDTVIPWADAHLPTSGERSIGGISAGGAAAIRLVGRNPDLFARLGLHSPVVDDSLGSWNGAVWIDVGSGDRLRPSVEALAARLGARAQLHVWPGGHDRAYWGAHVADYLAFYAGR